MTHSIKYTSLGVAAIVLSAGAAVFASSQNTAERPRMFMGHRPPFAGGSGPEGRFEPLLRLASRLGLTDTQKAEMKKVAQSHRDEWKALAQRAVTARQALHQAVTAEPIDDAAIRQRSGDVAAVEADMAVARAHARSEMLKVLTPQQQAQMKEMKDRRRTLH